MEASARGRRWSKQQKQRHGSRHYFLNSMQGEDSVGWWSVGGCICDTRNIEPEDLVGICVEVFVEY